MKKLFLVFAGLLSVVLWTDPGFAQDQPAKGPRLTVEGREFDFKDVKEGTVLEHTFKIFNKGDEPLKIISVKPG